MALVYQFTAKRNVASQPFYFVAQDGTVTGEFYTGTDLVDADVTTSKDGAAFVAEGGTVAIAASTGVMAYTPSAGETDCSELLVKVSDASAAVFLDVVLVIKTSIDVGQVNITGGASGASIAITNSVANGDAMTILGTGSGEGLIITGGLTGDGLKCVGGATSGLGLNSTATSTDEKHNLFTVTEGTQPAVAPADNASFASIMQFLKRRFFNKATQTTTTQSVFKDDSTTLLMSKTVSDDGITQSQGKMA